MKKFYIALIASLFALSFFVVNAIVDKKSKQVSDEKIVNIGNEIEDNGIQEEKKEEKKDLEKIEEKSDDVKNSRFATSKQKNVVKKAEQININNKKQQNLISLKSAVGSVKGLNVKKKKSRFYGRANVNIGYGYQKAALSTTKVEPIVEPGAYAFRFTDKWKDNKMTSNSVVAKVGYNFYINTGTFFDPFVGADLQGRMFIGDKVGNSYLHNDVSRVASSDTPRVIRDEVTGSRAFNTSFKEFAKLSGKIGGKINICKGFSLEISGIGGMNVMGISQKESYELNSAISGKIYEDSSSRSKINIGYVYGAEAGFNFGKDERFSLKAEWYNSVNKINNSIVGFGKKVRMQSIVATAGCRF